MKTIQYSVSGISYGYSPVSRKWEFQIPSGEKQHTFLTGCPGGRETAEKVAKIIKGSISRSGYLDGLARSNISKVVA